MRKSLKDIGGTGTAYFGGVLGVENLVPDSKVVCGASGSLQGGVCLEVEVPVTGFGDAAVDHGARLRVEGPLGFTLARGVEASVVPLSDDHDRHAGETLLGVGGWVRGSASLLQKGKLLVDYRVVLAL